MNYNMNTTYQYPFTPFPYYNGYPLMPFYHPEWEQLQVQQNTQKSQVPFLQMNACFPNQSDKKNDESSENCKVGERNIKNFMEGKFLGDEIKLQKEESKDFVIEETIKSSSKSSCEKIKKKQKILNQKIEKDDQSEDYEPKEAEDKNNYTFAPYPKKNTESNLVNQIFSFVSTPYKSMPTLMKILNQDRTKALYYYELFKAVKRGKKKYINRKFLMSLCKMEESHAGFKLFKRGRGICSTLSISEFRKSLIQLIWIFLDSQCVITITTSKKLNSDTWLEHLNRRRQVRKYIQNCLLAEK